MFNKLVNIKITRKLVLLVVVGCVFVACKKENDILEKNATLVWKGDYALDGCGFFIKIGLKEYKSANESIIDDSYKTSAQNMPVKVKYKLLNKNIKYHCGISPTPMKNVGEIEIISIKKR
jgi:hypothetical protein